MGNDMARAIRQGLEEGIIGQMEQIKEAFDEERCKQQEQSHMLQSELEEVHKELDKDRTSRKKMDEMSKTIYSLQREKKLADKTIEELQSTLQTTKLAMERRIDELKVEKDGAITAVKTEFVQSAKQSGKDKAAYEEEINTLKKKLAELEKDKDQMKNLKSVIDELVDQRETLQKSLNSAHQKLSDVDTKIENLTQLQKKYNGNVEKNNNKEISKPEEGQPEGLQKEQQMLIALKLERDRLETELETVSTKLVKANSELAQNRTQHAEEMKKYYIGNGIDIDNFTRLHIDLVDQQRQLRELQEFIEAKENEKNKKFKVKEEEMKKLIKDLEEDKNSLQEAQTDSTDAG